MTYHLSRRRGKIVSICVENPELQIVEVDVEGGGVEQAVNYKLMSGIVCTGDRVLLNTTAVELGLGTGGYHYIITNLSAVENSSQLATDTPGHIMKLRYTPLQMKTFSVEEAYRNKITGFKDLNGCPVVILPLHSLLAPLALVFKHFYPSRRLVYIMTEGGSLSLTLSHEVRKLVKQGLIDCTITIGQAFGGDLEAVNIFTGLIAASEVAEGDLLVVGMGPGITGTGTKFGFSGTENAFIDYAVRKLKGRSIFVPRISFADRRSRHFILSHHTITLLNELIMEGADLVFPQNKMVAAKVKEYSLDSIHHVYFYRTDEVEKILLDSGYHFHSMGRSFTDDHLFFITGGMPVLRYNQLQNKST